MMCENNYNHLQFGGTYELNKFYILIDHNVHLQVVNIHHQISSHPWVHYIFQKSEQLEDSPILWNIFSAIPICFRRHTFFCKNFVKATLTLIMKLQLTVAHTMAHMPLSYLQQAMNLLLPHFSTVIFTLHFIMGS